MRNSLLRALATFPVGVLGIFGFSPFDLWITPILSLVGFILLVNGLNLKWRLLSSYLFGLGFLGPLLHWSSIYVGAIPWILLVIGKAFFFLFLAFAFPARVVSPLIFGSLFVILEFLRAKIPFGGFGWGRLGFSQLDGFFQGWLRIGGVALTGGVVASISAYIALSLLRKRVEWRDLIVVGVISFLPFTASTIAFADVQEDSSGNFVRVGVIQGGVSQMGLEFNATPEEVFTRHFELTESFLQRNKPDFILWPENASDLDPLTNQRVGERISKITAEFGIPMVIGAVLQGTEGPENVSLLYDGNGALISRYQKRDLVPFGEYIPLRKITEKVSPLAAGIRDFVPGDSAALHKIDEVQFSPLICYEILDDSTVKSALQISNIGIVQTNNATFGKSWQSPQQFQMTRVRAYEYRIPFVVAATTGYSALISEDGQVLSELPPYDQGALEVGVKPRNAVAPPISQVITLAISLFLILSASFIAPWIRLQQKVKFER